MNFSSIIPTANSIPTSWEILQVLLLLTFIIHIIFVNILIGSGIIVSAYTVNSRKNTTLIAHQIGKTIPITMAFTINTGIAPLLLLQVAYGQFIFTSSVLMAVWWIFAVFLMVVSYCLIYVFSLKLKYKRSIKDRVILIATLMLTVIGFIISNNMTLMLSPKTWMDYFNISNGTLMNLTEPMLLPRYLHFICASIAVGGIFTAWLHKLNKLGNSKRINPSNTRQYLKWFIRATIIQFPIGILFLLSLNPEAREMLTGQDTYKTGLLIVGILSGLSSLILGCKGKLIQCTIACFTTVSLMTLLRDQVRKTYLSPFFNPHDLVVSNQYNLFVIFIIVAVLVVILLVYMLKIASRKKGETNQL